MVRYTHHKKPLLTAIGGNLSALIRVAIRVNQRFCAYAQKGLLVFPNNLVNQTIFFCLIRRHIKIAVGVFFDFFEFLAGIL